MSGMDLVQVAGWSGIGWLRHGFSTRGGGVSTVYGGESPDGTLNVGWTKEDDPRCVAENRRRLVTAVSGDEDKPMRLVTVRQVHSEIVRVIGHGDGALEGRLETSEGKAVLEGDGLVTNVPGVLLGVGTADCVPVLVVDQGRRAVGAFHAGWRGTVARIVEQGIEAMRREYGSRAEDLEAAVGPSIGACCYAVGDEVREKFAAGFEYGEELFRTDGGQMYVDLWEANRRQLLDAGVGAERIAVVGECTACARDAAGKRRYFSHRAERGVAGRMLNVVGIAG
jgi:YfiH family protein